MYQAAFTKHPRSVKMRLKSLLRTRDITRLAQLAEAEFTGLCAYFAGATRELMLEFAHAWLLR